MGNSKTLKNGKTRKNLSNLKTDVEGWYHFLVLPLIFVNRPIQIIGLSCNLLAKKSIYAIIDTYNITV